MAFYKLRDRRSISINLLEIEFIFISQLQERNGEFMTRSEMISKVRNERKMEPGLSEREVRYCIDQDLRDQTLFRSQIKSCFNYKRENISTWMDYANVRESEENVEVGNEIPQPILGLKSILVQPGNKRGNVRKLVSFDPIHDLLFSRKEKESENTKKSRKIRKNLEKLGKNRDFSPELCTSDQASETELCESEEEIVVKRKGKKRLVEDLEDFEFPASQLKKPRLVETERRYAFHAENISSSSPVREHAQNVIDFHNENDSEEDDSSLEPGLYST